LTHKQKILTRLTPSPANPNHTNLCDVCTVYKTESISRYYLIH